MSRQGRKRKQVAREPSGRPQRPTQAMLNELNRRETMKVKGVVLMQPHRKDAKDPEAKELEISSALERFWKRLGNDDKAMLDAGLKYKRLVRDWRSTKGIPCDPSPEERASTGTGEGPAWETVQGWLVQIDALERSMLRASFAVMQTTKRLVIYNIDPTSRMQCLDALTGLRIIGHELGMYAKGHPFR